MNFRVTPLTVVAITLALAKLMGIHAVASVPWLAILAVLLGHWIIFLVALIAGFSLLSFIELGKILTVDLIRK